MGCHDTDNEYTTVYDAVKMAKNGIDLAIKGQSYMGAFILLSCLIDAMTGFMKGRDSDGASYKKFIDQYINICTGSPYDPTKLWKDLRCKLVHGYSEGGTYVFTHDNQYSHLTTVSAEDQRLILVLEKFKIDVFKGVDSYLNAVNNDGGTGGLWDRFKKRFRNNGILKAVGFTSKTQFTPVSTNNGVVTAMTASVVPNPQAVHNNTQFTHLTAFTNRA